MNLQSIEYLLRPTRMPLQCHAAVHNGPMFAGLQDVHHDALVRMLLKLTNLKNKDKIIDLTKM